MNKRTNKSTSCTFFFTFFSTFRCVDSTFRCVGVNHMPNRNHNQRNQDSYVYAVLSTTNHHWRWSPLQLAEPQPPAATSPPRHPAHHTHHIHHKTQERPLRIASEMDTRKYQPKKLSFPAKMALLTPSKGPKLRFAVPFRMLVSAVAFAHSLCPNTAPSSQIKERARCL